MKYYGCIPIKKENELLPLKIENELQALRHAKRRDDAITELIAALALIDSKEIRELMLKYDVNLIEKIDGSYNIGINFPEKRFC